MTNQASEDTLTYGVDRGIPGGDNTALSIKKGSTLYTFVGDEAVAIIDLIRTEKLNLLDRLHHEYYEVDEETLDTLIEAERNKLKESKYAFSTSQTLKEHKE